MGHLGGYSDWPLGSRRHHVEIRGNGATSLSTLRSYFDRRALELCRAEGLASYYEAPIAGFSPNRYREIGLPFVRGDIECR
jgi:hypothetical protein